MIKFIFSDLTIFTFSLSPNDFIISMIKERIPAHLNYYCSLYPSVDIVKGAVIYGFDPYIIKRRKDFKKYYDIIGFINRELTEMYIKEN